MKLTDWFKVRGGDTLQVILKKKGEPAAGIYKTDTEEIRSPSLQKEVHDQPNPDKR